MKIKNIDIISFVNICIIILLVGLIANILFFKIKKEAFIEDISNSDEVKKELARVIVSINRENYKKYMEEKKKIIKGDFEIGYGTVPGITEESLGFCPLGQYYDGRFTNNKNEVFTHCKDCYHCSKEGNGYYTKKGCVGDKDSVCEHGKVPYNTFINIHQRPYLFHSQLPRHQHKYDFERKPNYKFGKNLNEFNYKLSDSIHQHPF